MGRSVLLLPCSILQPPPGFGCARGWQKKNSLSFNLAGAMCIPILDSKYPFLWISKVLAFLCWGVSGHTSPLSSPHGPSSYTIFWLRYGTFYILTNPHALFQRPYLGFPYPNGHPFGSLWGWWSCDDGLWCQSGKWVPLSTAGMSAAGFHFLALFLYWQL